MDESGLTRSATPGERGGVGWTAAVATIFSLLVMVWLAASADDLFDGFPIGGQQPGNYNSLVHSFQAGRASLEADADPRLLSADPKIREQVPVWLDTSVYRGRHYIYYGVVPAVLVMWPWTAITGGDLGENLVVLLGVAIGFLFSMAWWLDARRRYFPAIGSAGSVSLILVLAFGTGTPALLVRSLFYEIPVAWAYAFGAVACWATWHAWHRPRHPGIWLMAAATAHGLAVGCRPNFALSLPILAAVAWWIGRREGPGWRRPLALLACAVAPAAIVGFGLGAYNYVRFGNPLEFGFMLGQAQALSSTRYSLMSLRFIGANLRWYFLTPPSFSWYFPFFFPQAGSFRPTGYYGDEAMHGQLVITIFTLVVVTVWAGKMRAAVPWRRVVGGLALPAGMTIASLIFISLLGIRANRYSVDFVAPLLLVVTLAAGVAWSAVGRGRRLLLAVVAGLAIFVNLGVGLQQFNVFAHTRPRQFAALARILDRPARWLERAGAIPAGALRLEAMLPPVELTSVEPLLTTGFPYEADMLFLALHPGAEAELILIVQGGQELHSGRFHYEPGHLCAFEIHLGSLYPPLGGAFFSGIEPYDQGRAKTEIRVLVQGVERMRARTVFNEAPPWTIAAGRNDTVYMGDLAKRTFGSTVHAERTGQVPEQWAPTASGDRGVWRLEMELPPVPWERPMPLVASGTAGKGNLLFVKAVGEGTIQLGLDFWGRGLALSPIIPVTGGRHRLEFFLGPVANRAAVELPPGVRLQQQALHVWLDGRWIWSARIAYHADSYDRLVVGANPQGFTTAGDWFMGDLRPLPRDESAVEALLKKVAGRTIP